MFTLFYGTPVGKSIGNGICIHQTMIDLTSNPAAETLEEVEVMGRTVYVSQSSEEAYVEFQGELVSMTNLNAWNHLMEQAKQEAIDGYDSEKTLTEKQVEDTTKKVASQMRELADEIHRKADTVRRAGGTDE